MRPALVYHDDYVRYDFGGNHAMRQTRLLLTRDLINAYGLLGDDGGEHVIPDPAPDPAVERVHTPEYLAILRELSAEPTRASPSHGLGTIDNPVFSGMFEASMLHAGGTLRACEEVASGRCTRAFNLGGGFHHAMPGTASGFCLLNDLAVGMTSLLEDHRMKRILYVDIDAHHADGVQAIFYREPRVLTISLHEDGHYLFPGTGSVEETGEGEGRGYAVNVPLPPYTRDISYLYAFQEIVPPLARAYRPDVLVTQLGADAHHLDPLTHLLLTTETYEAVGHLFDGLSREICGGRWIATGGGGYDVTAVPRVWTILFAEMVGREIEEALPVEWLKECNHLVGSVPPEKALQDHVHGEEESHVPRAAKRTVDEIKRVLFPLHGIS